jgi:DNA-binding CsgD family transcriptional regulator
MTTMTPLGGTPLPRTPNRLTRREREILALIAQGLTSAEAADELVVAEDTVRTHVRNAMRKLQARTRTHAVVLALRSGALPLES